jgi:DNA-directed RNA polymerase subunit RPC12/RpoP
MTKPRPARATNPLRKRKQQKGPGYKASTKGQIGYHRPVQKNERPVPILEKGICQTCGYRVTEEASAVLVAAGHNQDLNCPNCGGKIPFASSTT